MKRRSEFSKASATGLIAPGQIAGIDDEMTVQMLGAGQEVGRSCCVIKFKGRTIVCDAGVHPAFSGMAALPFLDELDWSTVDCILITHFHLDHAASLTYVMEKVRSRSQNSLIAVRQTSSRATAWYTCHIRPRPSTAT